MVSEIAQLPVACAWGRWTLKHEYYRFFMFSVQIGRQCTHPPPQEWKSCNLRSMWHFGYQVKVTYWFWLMYSPPPRMEKLKSQVNVTFWFSGQCDSLVLADVSPPGMEKLKSEINVTFWVRLMYPPPPRNWNWTKHECYRTKRGHQVHFTIYPPPSRTIICFYTWTGNWWISI